jgi:hypothetical protein
MRYAIDHKNLRAQPECVVCHTPKTHGCVICWSCNSQLKAEFDGGYGVRVELLLDDCERALS